MKVLVTKLTSMGDVLHLMPALSDLRQHYPDVSLDWMVEESFVEIPRWHLTVNKVIAVATRRWRSLKWQNINEFSAFIRELRSEQYDVVIDAQGLMKSAIISRFAKLNKGGRRVGFSADSIKESPAARFYKDRIQVDREQHAIDRLRQLFAKAFDYELSRGEPDYDLNIDKGLNQAEPRPSILFFHGTTWPSKHLPDQYWHDLADLVTDDGYQVELCWGNEAEQQRAEWIAKDKANVKVLDKSTLSSLAGQINRAAGVIAVDTGLGHMAAALSVPTLSIYGATDARLTGAVGQQQQHIQTDYPCSPCLLKQCDKLTPQSDIPPCYQTLSPTQIWQKLYEVIA